jgi:hypothetical protein
MPQLIDFNLLFRLVVDLISVWLLVRFIYYSIYKTRDLFFSLIVTNLVIFLLSYALNGHEISMGAAFGLFAVFGMLRFRTEDISLKDMTYLFLSIALGVFNAVAQTSLWVLPVVSASMLLVTFLLESNLLYHRESARVVNYDRTDLLAVGREAEMLLDLQTKTGLPIHRFQVMRIDFLRDTVQLRVYFKD